MKELSLKAKLYVGFVLILGAWLFSWGLPQLDSQEVWLLMGAGALASATQVLKVEGQTAKSSYNISWMVFGFVLFMLGAPAALFVILVAHLAEWIWHRYPWYIQSFNIASYAVSVFLAQAVSRAFIAFAPESSGWMIIAILAGSITFTLVNHLLVGLVIKLARGESLRESGVLGILTLMIDFSLLCLGVTAAVVWTYSPLAIVLTIVPLYLIYSTLRVPALEQQTKLDEKTGLYNAKYFADHLEKELSRAEQFNRPLTIVLGDMDMLRNINNTYGHLAGDEVLKEVASILKASAREYDLVARFGGEEFAILMPESTPEAAYPQIEAIRNAIQSAEIEVETSVTPIRCTLSFGISGREGASTTANELVHNADVALYHAKLNGRNMTSIYSDGGLNDLFKVPQESGEPVPGHSLGTRLQSDLKPFQPSPLREARLVEEGPADQEPRAKPDRVNPYPSWFISAFVVGLAMAASGLAWFMLASAPAVDWMALLFILLITILAEGLAIDVYARDSSVSTSVAPFVAGALILGPIGSVLLSLSLAGVAWLKHRSSAKRLVFNASNHLLGGLLAYAVVAMTGIGISEHSTLAQFGLTVLAAGVVYLSTTMMVSGAIGLDMGVSVSQVWRERYRWLSPYYLALGCASYVIVLSYLHTGMLGILVASVPLFVLRLAQIQYVDRTKDAVTQLRELNLELGLQTEEIGQLSEELLITLAKVIDLRDPFVYGHSEHVTRYATMISRELGLGAREIELIRKAGLLHDIGKIAVPESILLKPAGLTAEEYEIVKQHTTLGAELLANCHSLHEIIPLVRHHHERYDGRGYPDQIEGEKLPLGARILALADSVDAMASDRPYRQALSSDQILAEVIENSGTQFDPGVAAAFVRILSREGTSVIMNSARKVAARQFDPQSIEVGVAVSVPTLAHSKSTFDN